LFKLNFVLYIFLSNSNYFPSSSFSISTGLYHSSHAHTNILTPYNHLFRFGATEWRLIPFNTFSSTKRKSGGDG